MESNIHEISDDLELEEPHFDQESTVLSARPVVPLDEVKSESRSVGRSTLLMVIGAALLIGALGATLIYKFSGMQPAQVVAESSAEEIKPIELASGVTGMTDAVREPETAPEPEITKAPEITRAERPLAENRVKPRPAPVGKAPKISEEEEWARERELRRAEKREARQQRRAEWEARRSGPGRPRRVGKDMSRIEEIFEGVRRP
jgi:hypothetical protein